MSNSCEFHLYVVSIICENSCLASRAAGGRIHCPPNPPPLNLPASSTTPPTQRKPGSSRHHVQNLLSSGCFVLLGGGACSAVQDPCCWEVCFVRPIWIKMILSTLLKKLTPRSQLGQICYGRLLHPPMLFNGSLAPQPLGSAASRGGTFVFPSSSHPPESAQCLPSPPGTFDSAEPTR